MIDDGDLYRTDRKTVLVALGGNALISKDQSGTISEQEENADRVAGQLMCLVEADYNIVITHGNGPQIGKLLLRNDLTKDRLPSMPLDVLVAETQGSIGYFLQQAFLNRLREMKIRRYLVTMITQVIVDKNDPAFNDPTKPIGLYYNQEQAEKLTRELGWTMKKIRDAGWRRLVPSPKPIKVIQRHMIRHSAGEGNIVIAGGGGGIPIWIKDDDSYEGIEAVIDKDLTSALIAKDIKADLLVILMAEPKVYIDYEKPEQKALDVLTVEQAKKYAAEGHFPQGSVGPKMAACVDFAQSTGNHAIIASPDELPQALAGLAGTRITPD